MTIKEAKALGIDVSHNGDNRNFNTSLPYPLQYVYGSVPCTTCGAYWYEACCPEDREVGPGGTFCDARIAEMERFETLTKTEREIERVRLTKAYKARKKERAAEQEQRDTDSPQLTLF